MALGSTSFSVSPSYTRIFEYTLEFSGSFNRVSVENCAIMSSVPGAHGALDKDELASSLR